MLGVGDGDVRPSKRLAMPLLLLLLVLLLPSPVPVPPDVPFPPTFPPTFDASKSNDPSIFELEICVVPRLLVDDRLGWLLLVWEEVVEALRGLVKPVVVGW